MKSHAETGEVQMIDRGDGNGAQPHYPVTLMVPVEEAEALAAARIARGDSDLYAADCRPIATAAADALVAAGLGRS